MPSLLENLKLSLEETKERLQNLKENGITSLLNYYPLEANNLELYHQLLKSLPNEIERLEKRIVELENKLLKG